ncbi:hydroxysqualene dehydroxylase HpnE [Plantactinospora sp. GCM10030261]|uniref:hydroxysqualene dehydroxylase HpnE n=1 Tax=Plantactinospora sp. GCM10030261 TaxID=3273420 RepID=UPI00360ACFC1
MTGDRDRVCVVGGGLAGIAAALRLADAGVPVTLVEARPRLGGATYSFRRGDLTVDTGQHVFLRCYAAYRGLLRRLGSARHTVQQDAFSVPVLAPGARPLVLARSRRLPAPAHLLPTLARYRALPLPRRLGAIRAAAALRSVDPDDPGADDASFGAWLASHRQDADTVRRLWDLICVAALNAPAAEASLALAARVFRTGLLDAADAADLGLPAAPLLDLHGRPARAALADLGGTVLTGVRVRGIVPGDGGFEIRTGAGRLPAAAVVLAVPHREAAGLVPAPAAPDRDRWSRLGATPIVNVHLHYARRVTGLPFAAVLDSPVQWVFDRTPATVPGQYLVVSLSAADRLLRRPAADLIAEQLAALTDLFPPARRTPLRDCFVTREPRATFRQSPGTRAVRPPAQTRLPGLALAGAWTATGWPDTMEGAVRSGQRAADVVLAHLGARTPTTEALT